MKIFFCVFLILGGVLTVFKFAVFREGNSGTLDYGTLPIKKLPANSHNEANPKKAEKTSMVGSKVVSRSDELFGEIEFLLDNGDFGAAIQAARNLEDVDHAAGLFELGNNESFPQGTRINLLTEAMRLFAVGGDIETAITVHLSSIGEGRIKKSLVHTLFKESDLSVDEFVELSVHLDSPDNVRRAFEGVGLSLARREHLDFSEIRKLVDVEPFGKEAVSELLSNFALSAQFRDYEDISIRLDESLSILKSLGLSQNESGEFLGKIIQESASLDPFAIWEKLNTDAYSDILSSDDVQLILKRMESKDFLRALEIVSADSSSRFREKDRMAVALRAISMDEKLARDSYQALSERKGADVSFFSAAFAIRSLQNGDFEEAREFVSNTKDVALQEIIKKQLWQKQQNSVVNEVKKDPEKTIDSFLDGTTKYEQYFLETAVSEWISSEPEEAAKWVEANGASLPNVSLQYVAAAYAKEAAAQGNLSLAQQWASRIQDEKTLTRINGIIQEAEQAASN